MSSGASSTISTAESRPLLAESQTTYDSVHDSTDCEGSENEYSLPTLPPITASRGDLVWILAGLWSAVFLGALDGSISANVSWY